MAAPPNSSTSTSKSITILPGQCAILPKDAVITSLIYNGSITATSTCNNLPTPTSYKCGSFNFFLTVNPDDTYPLDEESTYYTSLRVGGVTFTMNTLIVTGNNPGSLQSVATLNTYITDHPLFEFMDIQTTILSDRRLTALYFKVPEDLYDDTELKISDRGTYYYLKPIDATCGVYPEPE